MAGPWEDYRSTEDAGPWTDYGGGAPVDFSFMQMARNIPASAGKAFNDMLQPIMHPIDTAKAVGNVALGTVQKLIPGVQDSEVYADAVGQFVLDRYGSLEAFKRTAMEDPVGVAADISGVLTAGGGLVRAGTRAGGIANKAGRMVQQAGAVLDPINLAVNPVKAVASKMLPSSLAPTLYEGAAKFPPVSVDRPTRTKIVDAALDYGIMPTGRGIDKVTDILSGFDNRIDELIKAADATGAKIPRRVIYSELKTLKSELAQGAGAPANLRKFTKTVTDLEEMLKNGPDMWEPSKLQKFKTATYRDINWRGEPDARTETMQALARGARKAIEGVTPEIADVNKAYGPLAELRDRLPQVANRIDNYNPFSLSTMLGAGFGGAAGDIKGAILGGLAGMLNNPRASARLGIYLRGLENNGLLGNLLDNNLVWPALRQGLLQTGRLEELGFE